MAGAEMYSPDQIATGIRSIWVNQLFPLSPDDELRLLCLDRVYGNIQPYELFALITMVKSIRSKRIFEIGTFDGRTTRNFAANVADGGAVFSLDLPNIKENPAFTEYTLDTNEICLVLGSDVGRRYKGTPEEKRIKQLFCDSAHFGFEDYTNSIDLVFVDGSHAFPYVKSDSNNAFKIVKRDSGVIVWHDYGREFPDVKIYLMEIAECSKDWEFFHLNGTLMVVAVPRGWKIVA